MTLKCKKGGKSNNVYKIVSLLNTLKPWKKKEIEVLLLPNYLFFK